MGVLVDHGYDAGADVAVDDGKVRPQVGVGPGVGLCDPVRCPWFAVAHVAACQGFPGETERDRRPDSEIKDVWAWRTGHVDRFLNGQVNITKLTGK